jgi:hypothetical protein
LRYASKIVFGSKIASLMFAPGRFGVLLQKVLYRILYALQDNYKSKDRGHIITYLFDIDNKFRFMS